MFEAMEQKLSHFGDGILQKHSGAITQILEQQLAPKIRELAGDETKLKGAVSSVYNYLPPTVKGLVSEDRFSTFLLSHREVLMNAANRI